MNFLLAKKSGLPRLICFRICFSSKSAVIVGLTPSASAAVTSCADSNLDFADCNLLEYSENIPETSENILVILQHLVLIGTEYDLDYVLSPISRVYPRLFWVFSRPQLCDE